MEVIPFTTVDYLTEARERSTYQFQDKVVFDKYLQLLIEQQFELQQVFKDLLQKRSIDTATGVTLDTIGEIVGQPRELISADLYTFFGFVGVPNAGGYGDVNNPYIGAVWYDFGKPTGGNILLDDETYRLFIKAKILKNTTSSTPEEFISFINFLFGTTLTFVSEGNAEFTLFFGRELSNFEIALLSYTSNNQGYTSRLIPKTTGVKINFGIFQQDSYFGFQGMPNAKGYGDITGTYGYGLGYGIGYGDSDYSIVGGGVYATLI